MKSALMCTIGKMENTVRLGREEHGIWKNPPKKILIQLYLAELLNAMYDELPMPKKRR